MAFEKVCLLFPQDGHLHLHLLFGLKRFRSVLRQRRPLEFLPGGMRLPSTKVQDKHRRSTLPRMRETGCELEFPCVILEFPISKQEDRGQGWPSLAFPLCICRQLSKVPYPCALSDLLSTLVPPGDHSRSLCLSLSLPVSISACLHHLCLSPSLFCLESCKAAQNHLTLYQVGG